MPCRSTPGFVRNVLTRVLAALTVSLVLWLVRWTVQLWTWWRVTYFTAGLALRVLLVLWIGHLCFGQPVDPCLPGCDCFGRDRMDCRYQQFDHFSLPLSFRFPRAVSFYGSRGPWHHLPCYPFRDVLWVSFSNTDFACPQALEWAQACHLRVSASLC